MEEQQLYKRFKEIAKQCQAEKAKATAKSATAVKAKAAAKAKEATKRTEKKQQYKKQ